MKKRRELSGLRSQRWFASDDMRGFAHRQRTQQMGMCRDEFMRRPVCLASEESSGCTGANSVVDGGLTRN